MDTYIRRRVLSMVAVVIVAAGVIVAPRAYGKLSQSVRSKQLAEICLDFAYREDPYSDEFISLPVTSLDYEVRRGGALHIVDVGLGNQDDATVFHSIWCEFAYDQGSRDPRLVYVWHTGPWPAWPDPDDYMTATWWEITSDNIIQLPDGTWTRTRTR